MIKTPHAFRSRPRLLLSIIGIFIMLLLPAGAQSRRAPFADAPLPRNLHGEEAVQSLGSRLKEVAEAHDMNEGDLRRKFREDKSIWVDRRGRLFFVCEFPPPQQGPVGESTNTPPLNPLYQLSQTFKLHSRPGASRIIYLDFDGHDASTTIWGSGRNNAPVARPFDTDGNLFTIGNTERQSIQYIWARVAEDFLQYDIDVTTEEPPVGALKNTGNGRYGVRVVIGGDSADWYGNAGGVAYLFSFDDDNDFPCWVFPKGLGDNEKNIAEACSHEAGHTLGLFHDGQSPSVEYYVGHNNWAPIMGVGYDRPIVQWSQGEYNLANNAEDDLARMLLYGALPRPDDHGDTTGTATPLTGIRSFIWGVINTRTDVDFFSFQAGAGRTTITCTPAPRGPNLHILLSLYDSAGTLILSSNVADTANGTLPVSLAPVLPTGNYFISVDGVGVGNPLSGGYSDYSSLGQFTLSLTQPGDGSWTSTAAGTQSFTNVGKWNGDTFPLGANALARVNNDIAGDETLVVDMPVTLGGLALGDADASHAFTLSATGAGEFRFAATNGRAWIGKITGANDAIIVPIQLLTNLFVTNTTASSLTLGGSLTGAVTVTKTGPSVLVLGGTNSLTGLSIFGGSVQLGGVASVAGVGAITLLGGTIFDVSAQPAWTLAAAQTCLGSGVITGDVACAAGGKISPGTTGLPGTLGFSNRLTLNAGSALEFNLSGTTNAGGGVNDLIEVAGDLVLNSPVTVTLDLSGALPDTNAYYTLLTYGGALTGGAGNLVLANPGNRFTAVFDDSVAGQVRVQISGAPQSLVWQGDGIANVWNAGAATNWLRDATPDAFFQGDAVVFNPSGSIAPAVNLGGALSPASVTVSNTSGYTFSGTGRLTGATTITKQGSSSLTVNNSNDFSGLIVAQNGSLVVGNTAAFGLTNSGVIVSNLGQVDLNGVSIGSERLTVSGSGPAGDGVIVNHGAVQSNALRLVTLAGDATFGGTARWDLRGVPASNIVAGLTGNGFSLTKTGANEVWLANLGSMLIAAINVNQGVLGFEGANSMANSSVPLTVSAGATVAFFNAYDSDFGKAFAFNSCTLRNDSGHNSLTGAGTISGMVTALAEEASVLDLRGSLGGTGGFVKTGPGILRLAGANTFSGNITVSEGTLMAGSTTALGNSTGSTTIAPGGRLDVAATQLGAEPVFVSGDGINTRGAIINSLPNSQQNALRFVTLAGHTTFGGNGHWDIRANPTGSLQGAFDLTKVGQNEIWLSGLNASQLKAITVEEGLLGFQGTTTMGDAASTMTVNSGGTLGISSLGSNVLSKVLALNLGKISNVAGSNIFSGSVSLTSSNQLDVSSGATFVLAGTAGGSGHFGKTSGGILAIDGSYAASGASYVNSGVLQIGAGGSGGSVACTLNNNATIIFNRTSDTTHSALISGNGTLIKQRANSLTLSAANTFSGALTVAGGTLRVGDSAALGSTAGGTVITAGATLDVNGFNLGAEVVTASGAGVGGSGALINTSASQVNALRFLTLAADATLGGNARWDLRSVSGTGALSTGGQPHSLTKTGENVISLAGVTVDAALENVLVQQGVLALESVPAFGNAAATAMVSGGATLQLDLTNAFNKAVSLPGGGKLSWVGAAIGNINSPILLPSGDGFVENQSAAALQINGNVGGPGNFSKLGTGLVRLNGANTHSGSTLINTGTLALGPSATIAASTNLFLTGGAVFDVTALAGGLVLNPAQTLAGNGTVLGNVTANGTVSPGASIGALTISGYATLAGLTRMELNKSGATLTNDVLDVTGLLTCGGSLAVTHSGSALTVGNSFHLFNAGSITGTFASSSLPPLSSGLTWNLSTLHTDGWLTVVSNTPPVIASVRIAGGGIVMVGHGGAPGATFWVMTSTNVALPLAGWSFSATNIFDAAGNFAFTNALSPGNDLQFFRLQVP
jgi:autotransporter-associated beta strand protein